MAALLDHVDPDGLEEFSVVFTDRSLNSMSVAFQEVMNDISSMLKEVYHADAVALVPGGGTFGMEAVARQFARGAEVLVVRNGWFSYRWSQILCAGARRRGCRDDPDAKAGCGLCAACRNQRGCDPARRLHCADGGGDT